MLLVVRVLHPQLQELQLHMLVVVAVDSILQVELLVQVVQAAAVVQRDYMALMEVMVLQD